MSMFDGYNCKKKFVLFSVLIMVLFAAILTISSFLGFIASIITLGLLSILLRIIIDICGDRMLTCSEVYMNNDQIEKFGKKLLEHQNLGHHSEKQNQNRGWKVNEM